MITKYWKHGDDKITVVEQPKPAQAEPTQRTIKFIKGPVVIGKHPNYVFINHDTTPRHFPTSVDN